MDGDQDRTRTTAKGRKPKVQVLDRETGETWEFASQKAALDLLLSRGVKATAYAVRAAVNRGDVLDGKYQLAKLGNANRETSMSKMPIPNKKKRLRFKRKGDKKTVEEPPVAAAESVTPPPPVAIPTTAELENEKHVHAKDRGMSVPKRKGNVIDNRLAAMEKEMKSRLAAEAEKNQKIVGALDRLAGKFAEANANSERMITAFQAAQTRPVPDAPPPARQEIIPMDTPDSRLTPSGFRGDSYRPQTEVRHAHFDTPSGLSSIRNFDLSSSTPRAPISSSRDVLSQLLDDYTRKVEEARETGEESKMEHAIKELELVQAYVEEITGLTTPEQAPVSGDPNQTASASEVRQIKQALETPTTEYRAAAELFPPPTPKTSLAAEMAEEEGMPTPKLGQFVTGRSKPRQYRMESRELINRVESVLKDEEYMKELLGSQRNRLFKYWDDLKLAVEDNIKTDEKEARYQLEQVIEELGLDLRGPSPQEIEESITGEGNSTSAPTEGTAFASSTVVSPVPLFPQEAAAQGVEPSAHRPGENANQNEIDMQREAEQEKLDAATMKQDAGDSATDQAEAAVEQAQQGVIQGSGLANYGDVGGPTVMDNDHLDYETYILQPARARRRVDPILRKDLPLGKQGGYAAFKRPTKLSKPGGGLTSQPYKGTRVKTVTGPYRMVPVNSKNVQPPVGEKKVPERPSVAGHSGAYINNADMSTTENVTGMNSLNTISADGGIDPDTGEPTFSSQSGSTDTTDAAVAIAASQIINQDENAPVPVPAASGVRRHPVQQTGEMGALGVTDDTFESVLSSTEPSQVARVALRGINLPSNKTNLNTMTLILQGAPGAKTILGQVTNPDTRAKAFNTLNYVLARMASSDLSKLGPQAVGQANDFVRYIEDNRQSYLPRELRSTAAALARQLEQYEEAAAELRMIDLFDDEEGGEIEPLYADEMRDEMAGYGTKRLRSIRLDDHSIRQLASLLHGSGVKRGPQSFAYEGSRPRKHVKTGTGRARIGCGL